MYLFRTSVAHSASRSVWRPIHGSVLVVLVFATMARGDERNYLPKAVSRAQPLTIKSVQVDGAPPVVDRTAFSGSIPLPAVAADRQRPEPEAGRWSRGGDAFRADAEEHSEQAAAAAAESAAASSVVRVPEGPSAEVDRAATAQFPHEPAMESALPAPAPFGPQSSSPSDSVPQEDDLSPAHLRVARNVLTPLPRRLPEGAGKSTARPKFPRFRNPGDVTRVVSSVLIVVSGLWLFLLLFRRQGPRGRSAVIPKAWQIVDVIPLAPRRQLHLVRIGTRLLLLNLTASNIDKIAEFTDPEEVNRILYGPEGYSRQSLRQALHASSATAATSATAASAAASPRVGPTAQPMDGHLPFRPWYNREA